MPSKLIINPGDPLGAGLVLAAQLTEAGGSTLHNAVDNTTAALGAGWTWMDSPLGPAISGDGTQAQTFFSPASVPTADFAALVQGYNTAGPWLQQDWDQGGLGWSYNIEQGVATAVAGGGSRVSLNGANQGLRRILLMRLGTVLSLRVGAADGTNATVSTSGASAGTLRSAPQHRWYLGGTNGQAPDFSYHDTLLNGWLAAAYIWNRALTEAEVAGLFPSVASPAPPQNLAYTLA